MPSCHFVVNTVSYRYATLVIDYIHRQLRRHARLDVKFATVDRVEDAEVEPGSLVFLVGEGFDPFRREAGCRYVYLNFSTLHLLGNPLRCSPYGWRHLRDKRRMFLRKLDCLDYVLDYYPAHTEVLRRRIALPVRPFPVCVNLDDLPPLGTEAERIHDVCIVGAPSPRREKLYAVLRERGFALSPERGVRFEDIAAQSKVVLNVRSWRYNHMEVPRIVSTLLCGAALVTEHCHGMERDIPSGLYAETGYGGLADAITRLLADAPRRQAMARAGLDWARGTYVPRCDQAWAGLVRDIEDHFGMVPAVARITA